MSFELGDKKWKLTASDGRRGPSRYSVDAGDKDSGPDCIRKAKERCKVEPQAKVHSCYEAGRDGWWLHRWLIDQGIDNIVVDSASIEVNRRARRAKTDRLDGDKLLAMLLRHRGGERVWSVLHEPTPEEEDARRSDRELARLTKERTAAHEPHRLAAGAAQPAPAHRHRRARLGAWWERHGDALASGTARRDRARDRTAGAGQAAGQGAGGRAAPGGRGRQAAAGGAAVQLRAIGIKSAWLLDKELFGWRRFANRRELAGCLGLVPTPYDSGDSQIEQGISKAGNKRARALLVELAWGWLRLQPDSALTQWFNRRFAAAASACGAWASWRWRGAWRSRCGAIWSTARSRPGPCSSRPPPEGQAASAERTAWHGLHHHDQRSTRPECRRVTAR